MLDSRVLKFGEEPDGPKAIVESGCPQGGVLCPLLWNFFVNSLLRILNANGFYAIGYADDIVILLNERFEGVLCHLRQEAFDFLKNVEHVEPSGSSAHPLNLSGVYTPRLWLYEAIIRPMLSYGALVW